MEYMDIMFNESVDGREDILMARYIIKGIWAVFLNPVCASMAVPQTQRRQRCSLPGEIVLCLNWQVCNNSLSPGGGVFGAELNR